MMHEGTGWDTPAAATNSSGGNPGFSSWPAIARPVRILTRDQNGHVTTKEVAVLVRPLLRRCVLPLPR